MIRCSSFYKQKIRIIPRCYIKKITNVRFFNSHTLSELRNYLEKNKLRLKVEENESGFLRVCLPKSDISKILKDNSGRPLKKEKIDEISKLRLNFWRNNNFPYYLGDASIHNHPSSFETFIISGSYRHKIYLEKENNDIDNNIYTYKCSIFKSNGGNKGLGDIKISRILEVAEKSPKSGDLVKIDSSIIHKVIEYNKPTLTFNKVFNDSKGFYNVYIPKKNQNLIKLTRKTLSIDEANLVISDIIKTLENYELNSYNNKNTEYIKRST